MKSTKIYNFFWAVLLIFLPNIAKAAAILPTTPPENWTLCNFYPGSCTAGAGGTAVLNNVISIAQGVAGTIAAIFIVIGGFQYLTAYGDENKANAGKTTLTWAVIGLVVIILSRVLVGTIWRAVAGGSYATPAF